MAFRLRDPLFCLRTTARSKAPATPRSAWAAHRWGTPLERDFGGVSLHAWTIGQLGGGRVDQGDHSPRPPTDPGMRESLGEVEGSAHFTTGNSTKL